MINIPLYKYICPICGKKQEILKPISDYKNIENCIDCKSVLARDISDLASHFRGDSTFFDGNKLK